MHRDPKKSLALSNLVPSAIEIVERWVKLNNVVIPSRSPAFVHTLATPRFVSKSWCVLVRIHPFHCAPWSGACPTPSVHQGHPRGWGCKDRGVRSRCTFSKSPSSVFPTCKKIRLQFRRNKGAVFPWCPKTTPTPCPVGNGPLAALTVLPPTSRNPRPSPGRGYMPTSVGASGKTW